MSSFELLENFIEDPEQLLRNTRCHKVPPQRFILNLNPLQEGGSTPPPKEAIVQKTVADFSAPLAADVAIGPHSTWGMPLSSLSLH
jgi:hypothetical protein